MPPSFVWEYFEKSGSNKARCQFKDCKTEISYVKGMAGLTYHLKTHKITKTSKSASDQSPQKKRQRTLNECNFNIKLSTIEEDVAKMVAESNFSFNQVATSSFIRDALSQKYPGSTIPKKADQVSQMVMKFYHEAIKDVKGKIREMKENGQKFSASLDEWTSVANCRYLNINLHFAESETVTSFINLGLLKIHGSCAAEKLVEMVKE